MKGVIYKEGFRLPPCKHIEAQGKNAQGKNYVAKKAKRLQKENNIYEFGRFFDMTSERDVADLLSGYHDWFHKIKLPKDVHRVIDFAQAWNHSRNRKLILDMLVHYGNRVAALFASALSGRLTQERYDTWNFAEPQFLESFVSIAWLCVVLYMIYQGSVHGDKIAKLLGSVGKATDSVATVTGVVAKVVDTVTEACNATMKFFKQMYDMVVDKIKNIDVLAKDLLKLLLKVVLVIVAFEFARTMFGSMYKEIKSWMCILRIGRYDV